MNLRVVQNFLSAYKIYSENLENKDILYIFKDKNNNIASLNLQFLKENFTHLTGIKNYTNKVIMKNLEKENINNLYFKTNNLTFLKLDNFELIKQIINNSNLYITVHDKDKSIKLVADKLIGNEKLTLAIGENKLIKKYYPKSFLVEPILNRSKGDEIYKVEGIFYKNINKEKFNECTYINGNILDKIVNNEDFKEIIDVNLYDKLKKIKENKKNFYSRDDDLER
ncbi:PBECR4 domain-containing protein [Sneathia sanguinegens]|uniref:PBECR4 domain-containing protein n=1 Tax=Sneathia sanguinegens TaxID=40543 RepID=UPI0023F9A040|nr:PBECR4 domain-containing protein [Sneathia sanguinegens]